jgi:hypothetical protein
LCTIVGGSLEKTEEAQVEGIIAAGWYSKDQLVSETIYPELLKYVEWKEFFCDTFQTKYLPLTCVDF